MAHFVMQRLRGLEPVAPPATTAHCGLITQITRAIDDYQPSNITFALIPPWTETRLHKRARYEKLAERALADLGSWLQERGNGVVGEQPLAGGDR